QQIADARDVAALSEVKLELADRFGALPEPVERLFEVASLRALLRRTGVSEVVAQGAKIRFFPVELPESATLRLNRLYPGTIIKPAVRTILVPRPATARVGGEPLRDSAIVTWATELIESVLAQQVAA
ncbi:MAG: TRCF domain-containing protein, partial [Actinomycetes bacterium]